MTASHNNAAVRLTFGGGIIPLTMPGEYKTYITEMRSCFSKLDSAISAVEAEMENGDSLDSVRVKAVFYGICTFDEITVRQLVSSVKVLDKERLLVCFRDGEEIMTEKE